MVPDLRSPRNLTYFLRNEPVLTISRVNHDLKQLAPVPPLLVRWLVFSNKERDKAEVSTIQRKKESTRRGRGNKSVAKSNCLLFATLLWPKSDQITVKINEARSLTCKLLTYECRLRILVCTFNANCMFFYAVICIYIVWKHQVYNWSIPSARWDACGLSVFGLGLYQWNLVPN